MKRCLLLICLLVIFQACGNSEENNKSSGPGNSHYDVRLKIIPDEQFISVSGSLRYVVREDSLGELSFALHNRMRISEFAIVGGDSYRLDTSKSEVRWQPDAMRVLLSPGKDVRRGDVLDIRFVYQGKIKHWLSYSGNVIGPDWVEMGLYFPWYPSIDGQFTYRVTVEIDPEYDVFAFGRPSGPPGMRVFESEFPVEDLVVCASKDLSIRETTLLGRPVQIVNTTLSDPTVDLMQADIEKYYSTYIDWFGEIEARSMSFVISKREKGGGYSRTGGVILGGMDDSGYSDNREKYTRYLGHEIAHQWWHSRATDWEDWLNESFAEYSALLLIRELFGEEAFEARLDKKIGEIEGTPPVWELDRNSPMAYRVLYSKGVVLLAELEETLGNAKFLEVCRARIDRNAETTVEFLEILRETGGDSIAGTFEHSLRTR